MWGVRVWIINGRVTRKNLDDRSHRGYFMGWTSNTGVIFYWKPDQIFIHRAHHVRFDEDNSSLSIEDKHLTGSLLIQQDPEIYVQNSDPLNFIPCGLDLPSTPFCDTKIITYEIDLPPYGKKVCFNLLDYEDFTIPYIPDTIPNSPAGRQLPTQAKRKFWIIAIDGEDPVTDQGVLDELNSHQIPCRKPKINISLCRRKIFQRTYLEYIRSRFYQIRPVVWHLEVCLPNRSPTPKNIGEVSKVPQRKFCK